MGRGRGNESLSLTRSIRLDQCIPRGGQILALPSYLGHYNLGRAQVLFYLFNKIFSTILVGEYIDHIRTSSSSSSFSFATFDFFFFSFVFPLREERKIPRIIINIKVGQDPFKVHVNSYSFFNTSCYFLDILICLLLQWQNLVK